MKTEYSCGAVVFTHADGEIQYVIIQSLEGIYGFPKGHMEDGEDEKATALREVLEETGLCVQLLDGFRYVDRHPIPSKPGVTKQITYFLAEYENQEIRYQKELLSAKLMCYTDAMNVFQFESSQMILAKAHEFLHKEFHTIRRGDAPPLLFSSIGIDNHSHRMYNICGISGWLPPDERKENCHDL